MNCKRQKRWDRRSKISAIEKIGRSHELIFFLLVACLAASPALAKWNAQPETIAGHPTWIYTPDGTLPATDKRGLMVVLHGCAQTHDEIKEGGNLENAADSLGLVVAVPYVTKPDGYFIDCWDYDDGTADNHGHLAEMVALTENLMARDDLMIDPGYVYVVGLSSGGALALKLGCKAPAMFAGIGAIAGPSVGSDQSQAVADQNAIPSSNVANAVATCQSLADDEIASLQSQIALIAYGTMDRNGPQQIHNCWDQSHPGQNCVASIRWSTDNVKILRQLYGVGELGPETAVQGGKGMVRSATADGKTVLSLLVIPDVGHAWPAGTGAENTAQHGQYIAQKGLNYPFYAADWLVTNNRRANLASDAPVLICDAPAVSATSVVFSCAASGPNPISSYHIVLSGPTSADDTLPGASSFANTYDDLAYGTYTATVTATDNQGKQSNTISGPFDYPGAAMCIEADNASHVTSDRAYECGAFGLWACAKGSGDDLGLNYSFFTSSVKQTGPDYWIKVPSCP